MVGGNGDGGVCGGGGGGEEDSDADGGRRPEAEAAVRSGRHQGEDGQNRVTVSFVRSGGWRE